MKGTSEILIRPTDVGILKVEIKEGLSIMNNENTPEKLYRKSP